MRAGYHEVVLIGGAEVYQAGLHLVDEILLSRRPGSHGCDTMVSWLKEELEGTATWELSWDWCSASTGFQFERYTRRAPRK